MAIVRKKLTFYGSVQGVGFRYRAKAAADEFRLTGSVKNMPDGTVEAYVQGDEELITRFITQINKGRFVNITGIDTCNLPLEENERSFKIASSYYDY
ncbi:MAG: acylphosphatase [Lachnospiraceae bacterium]|nr:acylphosphatase [Lachnospiraceae bacterium]